ncbi:MAG: M36 family metallopeptidase [Flavobacteriales bacterium]|nr:M36 family metallopeptidase [Flavobacteriales bacterium]
MLCRWKARTTVRAHCAMRHGRWHLLLRLYGWHDTNGAAGAEFTITRGNNVFACEDANADDLPGFSPNSATLDFDYPMNLANAPEHVP